MHYYTFELISLAIITVTIVYNTAKPFGWRSALKINRRYEKHINGACYEIFLVAWRKKGARNLSQLAKEISRAHYAFAREEDMVILLDEMDLPPSFSIYSVLPDGRVIAIDASYLKKNHVKRTTDSLCMGDYDLYAIVNQELVGTYEPTHTRIRKQRSVPTVA